MLRIFIVVEEAGITCVVCLVRASTRLYPFLLACVQVPDPKLQIFTTGRVRKLSQPYDARCSESKPFDDCDIPYDPEIITVKMPRLHCVFIVLENDFEELMERRWQHSCS